MNGSANRIDTRLGWQVAFLVFALISGLLGSGLRVVAGECGACGVSVATSSAHDCCAEMPAATAGPALEQSGSCECSLRVPAESAPSLASVPESPIQLVVTALDVEVHANHLPETLPHLQASSPHPPGAPLYLAHSALLI